MASTLSKTSSLVSKAIYILHGICKLAAAVSTAFSISPQCEHNMS
jgi:hypothetical protein